MHKMKHSEEQPPICKQCRILNVFRNHLEKYKEQNDIENEMDVQSVVKTNQRKVI